MPLPTSNPVLAELHERFAGDYLRRFVPRPLERLMATPNLKVMKDEQVSSENDVDAATS